MKEKTGKNPQASKYQRQFWMLASRQLPHHTLLVFSVRIRARNFAKLLSKRRSKVLSESKVKAYAPMAVSEYQSITKETKLWHGTGRFQYVDGKVVDTFKAILQSGSLNPVKDAYAILMGGDEMISISTTPLRIIARSYADTHGLGEKEEHRYGSSLWWVAYYYSFFYGRVFTKHSVTILRNWSRWNAASQGSKGERLWGRKVNQNAVSVWDVFGSGSDIQGNYPILFGIKHYAQTANLPKTMGEAEVRLTRPVKLSDLSHLEVPENKVDEVRALLGQSYYSVAVLPIELGEYVASGQSFASLLGIATHPADY